MPIIFDSEKKKWFFDLTDEEMTNLGMLIDYLKDRVGDARNFVDKNNTLNTLYDLRIYRDEDFYNS